jgi:hypothetical protein
MRTGGSSFASGLSAGTDLRINYLSWRLDTGRRRQARSHAPARRGSTSPCSPMAARRACAAAFTSVFRCTFMVCPLFGHAPAAAGPPRASPDLPVGRGDAMILYGLVHVMSRPGRNRDQARPAVRCWRAPCDRGCGFWGGLAAGAPAGAKRDVVTRWGFRCGRGARGLGGHFAAAAAAGSVLQSEVPADGLADHGGGAACYCPGTMMLRLAVEQPPRLQAVSVTT